MPTPSILLIPDRYKAAKLYSQIPDSGAVDFGVTRATTAYRTNASGILESVASGVPRLDYPIGGGCPSLLVEPAATNLVLRSEEFDNVSWQKGRTTVTANTTVAPNGTTTADTLIDETATAGTHRVITGNIALTSGTTYSSSCFFKAGTSTRIEIVLLSAVEGAIGITATVFDLSAGTIISGSGRIENYGNGWFRCTNTGTSNFTGNGSVFIYLYNSANQRSYTGDASNTVSLWGAQLETGAYPTSYIPTLGSSVTRLADAASKTGISSLIGQTAGTLYADVNWTFKNEAGSPVVGILTINNNVANLDNCIILGIERQSAGINRVYCLVQNAGATEAGLFGSSISSGRYKIALAYTANDFVLYVNGAQIATDTSGSVPTTSQVLLGPRFNGDSVNIADSINAAALYTTRLSNSELASLTSL